MTNSGDNKYIYQLGRLTVARNEWDGGTIEDSKYKLSPSHQNDDPAI